MIFSFDPPQISINHGLEDHVDVLGITEDSIKLNNVFVVEVEVNFDLTK